MPSGTAVIILDDPFGLGVRASGRPWGVTAKGSPIIYFEIVSASGGYRARIRGGNNEIMFTTEVYITKASALNAIRVVQAGAATAPIYDRTA